MEKEKEQTQKSEATTPEEQELTDAELENVDGGIIAVLIGLRNPQKPDVISPLALAPVK